MINGYMGLEFGNNYYVPSRSEEGAQANLFFQQSFNKMLGDVMSGESSGDDLSGGGDLLGSGMSGGFDQLGSNLGTSDLLGSNSAPSDFSSMAMQPLFQVNACSSLIGKLVEYSKDSSSQTGLVEKVVVDSGIPYLQINGNKVSLEQVVSIT